MDKQVDRTERYEWGELKDDALPVRDPYHSHVPSRLGSFGHLPSSVFDAAATHSTLPILCKRLDAFI